MKKISLALLSIASYSFAAVDVPELNLQEDVLVNSTFGSYKGTQITPDSIVQLTPPMPEELKAVVDGWFEKEENCDRIAGLAATPNTLTGKTFIEKRTNDKEMLAQLQKKGLLELCSKYNSVLVIKTEAIPFVLKICAENAKIDTLLRMAKIDLDKISKEQFGGGNIKISECSIDYDKINPPQKTFFTFGRAAKNLRAQEVCKKEGLGEYIRLNDVYLYHIPGTLDDTGDDYWAEVEPFIDDLEPLKRDWPEGSTASEEQRKRIDALPFAAIRAKYILARNAGYCDVLPKNVSVDEKGRFVVYDNEIARDSRPDQFLYKDREGSDMTGREQYVRTVAKGIEHLQSKIFAKKEQRDYVEFLFDSDKTLKEACEQYNCMPEFKDKLDMQQ